MMAVKVKKIWSTEPLKHTIQVTRDDDSLLDKSVKIKHQKKISKKVKFINRGMERRPWHGAEPSPDDVSLIEEADNEGSWGWLLAACSVWNPVGEKQEQFRFFFSRVKQELKKGTKSSH